MAHTGPLDQVRDDVWALTMPMPGAHMPYSFAYLLRDSAGGLHVIDPGLDLDENWGLLGWALGEIGAGLGGVRSIVATHLHPDHLGMADRLRRATGARLLLHRAEQEALDAQPSSRLTPETLAARFDEWAVPSDRREEMAAVAVRLPVSVAVRADAVLEDGERLDIPGFELTAIWTPGHTPGSLTLRDDRRSIILTGDHVLPVTFSGLGLGGATPGNPLAEYLSSLDRVAPFADHEVLPGHEHRFTGLAVRTDELAEHHLRRSREVASALEADAAASIWWIASQLTWTAGWKNLEGFLLFSALSQTAMHREALEIPAVRARL